MGIKCSNMMISHVWFKSYRPKCECYKLKCHFSTFSTIKPWIRISNFNIFQFSSREALLILYAANGILNFGHKKTDDNFTWVWISSGSNLHFHMAHPLHEASLQCIIRLMIIKVCCSEKKSLLISKIGVFHSDEVINFRVFYWS